MMRARLTRLYATGLALAACTGPATALTLLDYIAGNATVDQLPAGAHLARYWLAGPDVLCNDGTAPAIYVRRGSAADRDKWIIFLQGGGNCGSEDECLDRWQHVNSAYGLQKMSTSVPKATWDTWHPSPPAPQPGPAGWVLDATGNFYEIPPTIGGRGIFSARLTNNFRGWNKVYAYYCTSDDWTGQATDHAFTTAAGPLFVSFRGATVFDAIVTALRSGLVYTPPGGEPIAMPDLDNAAMVLLGGSSAGANGVKHNIDLLRDTLHASNPDMEVRGVVDAAGVPFTGGSPWPPIGPAVSYEQYVGDKWTNTFLAAWSARVDASCLASNPASVQYRCADGVHILRHHLTSPFFHRMDLQDANGIDNYTGIFYPAAAGYPGNLAESRYARDISMQLQDLGRFATNFAPRYADELAAIAADPQWLHPGIFGPRCTNHVGLPLDNPFFQQLVPDSGGVGRSYHDTLWQWVNQAPAGIGGATGPVLVTATGVGSAGPPQCP